MQMMFKRKVWIEYLGLKIDILPFAKAAVQLQPSDQRVDARALAELFKKLHEAKNYRVLKKDNPFNIDIQVTEDLVSRVLHWARSTHRLSQLTDPGLTKLRPLAEVVVEEGCCAAAQEISGKPIPPNELPLIPLSGCPLGRCDCDYKSLRRTQLKERGVN